MYVSPMRVLARGVLFRVADVADRHPLRLLIQIYVNVHLQMYIKFYMDVQEAMITCE